MAAAIRDPRGRFQIGTMGGPGRPPRATEENYLLALVDACPLETWAEIVEKAVSDAREGDDKARHWLASFLIGSPKGPAPIPSAALVGRMLGHDPVLESAARTLAQPQVDALMWPVLTEDTERARAIQLEAQAAILTLEAEAGAL